MVKRAMRFFTIAAVLVLFSSLAHGEFSATKKVYKTRQPYAIVTGTAFWTGGSYTDNRNGFLAHGEARDSDWTGDPEQPHLGLEHVILFATPIRATRALEGRYKPQQQVKLWASSSAPQDNTASIYCFDGTDCTHAILVTGNNFLFYNYRGTALTLTLKSESQVIRNLEIPANSEEFPVAIPSVPEGIYTIRDSKTDAIVTWLYRTTNGRLAVGPTHGGCRYFMALYPGRYRLLAWHPYLAPIEKEIDVEAGTSFRLNAIFTAQNQRP